MAVVADGAGSVGGAGTDGASGVVSAVGPGVGAGGVSSGFTFFFALLFPFFFALGKILPHLEGTGDCR